LQLIKPVLVEPWLAEWDAEKSILQPLMDKADTKGSRRGESPSVKGARTTAFNQAKQRVADFLDRLRAFTVLDPACGSGNFLFMLLRALKDLEQRIMIEAEEMGVPRQILGVNPRQVLGIEINEYAAELARITIWIGELQLMIQNGYGARRDPILLPLEQIQCRDALVNADGSEADWPAADVIVGNPPFIGGNKMRSELGPAYT
ncbi:SAM-dependent methyltransferase, partial [Pseudofulvimonas gallinarii]|uniref:DNA methyltransferase n=1 Tax=Pseudofulvimonas gallinarii TaxID=634155 RepID=UPI00109F2659